MNETSEENIAYNFTNKVIQRAIQGFSEKSEMLAAEAYDIFHKKKPINKIISIIIIHQAAELGLKSLCIKREHTIYKKKDTISFNDALNRNKNILNSNEQEVLNILNEKRRNFQHSALFDQGEPEELKELLLATLSIIIKILSNVNCQGEEIKMILENENSLNNDIIEVV